MSGTTDKISGIANEAMGKAKQGVGSAVGSEKLKGEGAAQDGDSQEHRQHQPALAPEQGRNVGRGVPRAQ